MAHATPLHDAQDNCPTVAGRVLDVAVTVLSLGTNKLLKRGTNWLNRHGLTAYVVPVILLNEAFGAARAFSILGGSGWF